MSTVEFSNFDKEFHKVIGRVAEIASCADLRDSRRIFIEMGVGERFPALLLAGDRVVDLKDWIKDKMGPLREECKLIYRGRILVDYNIVDECGFDEDGVITVAAAEKLLTVGIVCNVGICVVRGRILAFACREERKKREMIEHVISNNDKVINVKKVIHQKRGVSQEQQILLYQGMILEDDKTVGQCQVPEHSVIDVRRRRQWNVNVINIYADINRCVIQLFAKTMGGERLAFEANNYDRVVDIKKEIEEKLGLSPEEQKLMYQVWILEDDKALSEYHILDGSVINVVARIRGGGGIRLFVQTTAGNTIYMVISESSRIIDIKRKIQEETGLPAGDQRLVHQGVVLEDDKTADYYHMAHESVIEVTAALGAASPGISVSITTVDNRRVSLRVLDSCTIRTLMNMVEWHLGLHSDEHILKFDQTILRDGSKTLNEYNITADCAIEVVPIVKLTINVLTDTMNTVRVEILNCDRMCDVKRKIRENTGIPESDQTLVLQGNTNGDNNTVDECRINDNSDIVVRIAQRSEEDIRGICLVISNETFTTRPRRIGTKIDEENIKRTFEGLKYSVEIHRNVPHDNMNRIIERMKRRVERSHRMLILFVLSHGEENGIITSDDQLIAFEQFATPLSNSNFSIFAGKPKLFFFSCCRGTGRNAGVSPTSACDVDTGGHHVEFDGPTDPRPSYPSVGDMFFGYSTSRCYLSCRDENDGTFYIKHLCEVIDEHPRWSISDIHQEVQSRASHININGQGHFQMPEFTNSLTPHVYFVG